MDQKVQYILQIADNAMIIGHRLSEWCGHGPILEQDIALTNIALDHLGLARNLYQYCAELEGGDKTEDYYPYQRDVRSWRHLILCEQSNGHFGETIVRQFLYDSFNYFFLESLTKSKDQRLSDIAAKSLKETAYHLQFSRDWMIRLGDGTEESHKKMQTALHDFWMYSGEALKVSELDRVASENAIGVDLDTIRTKVQTERANVIREAKLEMPEDGWMQDGGKDGRHSEQLGYILADLQHLQRAYPGATW